MRKRITLTETELKNIIAESVRQYLMTEGNVVTFGKGVTYPKYGWCVIMAGAGGSGKGNALNYNIPIHGKIVNVDDYKQLYAKYHDRTKDPKEYDFTNPDDTNRLHQIIRQSDVANTVTDSFFAQREQPNTRLDNIIFDKTAKSLSEFKWICQTAREIGYKTMIVWVCTSEQVALKGNATRARRVNPQFIYDARDRINSYLPKYLKENGMECFDEAWLVFNSDTENYLNPLDKNANMAIHLIPNGYGFDYPEGTWERLVSVMKPAPRP